MQWLIQKGKQLIWGERTPKKLAWSASIGIFVAFSPFLGIHWLLTIIFSWLFGLNIGVMYAASHIVNNPLTMVPIYLADYTVGKAIASALGINIFAYNPLWMQWLNLKLSCLGIPNVSLWAFLLGGNVLGALVALAAYPLLVQLFKRIVKEQQRAEQ